MRARLTVCTTCRMGRDVAEGDTPPGAHLHAAVRALLAARPDLPVDLAGIACLAGCERGCCAAISMPGKWTYLLGQISPGLSEDLLAYAEAYLTSRSGAVLPSRRPDSMRASILGRVPGAETPT